jgi:hypothetical protein
MRRATSMFSHSSGHPRGRLARPPAEQHRVEGAEDVVHVVPDMTAVAVPGQGVAVQRVQQAERDQLLRLPARGVVVRAAADHRLDPERGSVRETSRSPARVARQLPVPYAIVFVVGGALFALVPALSRWSATPEAVPVVFLPPLLYAASIYANFGRSPGPPARAHAQCRPPRARDDVRGPGAHALSPGLSWEAASASGRSSRRPTRSPRRRSCGASTPVPHGQRNRRQGPLQRRHRAGGPPCRGDGRKLLARRGRLGVRPLSGRRLAIGVAVGPIAAEIR